MLEQKWTKTKNGRTFQEQRSSTGWESSLSLRWAVVKFVVDEGAEKERGRPKIERKPEPLSKGVNEMLAELRVKDVTNQAPQTGTEKSKFEGAIGTVDVTKAGAFQDTEEATAPVAAGGKGAG